MKSVSFPARMSRAAVVSAPVRAAAQHSSFLETAARLAASDLDGRTAAEPQTPVAVMSDRLSMRAGQAGTELQATAQPQADTAARAAFLGTAPPPDALRAEQYRQYLEKRFGPVTIESIGRDQASLDAAGRRMRGRDVVIAPNIFAQMAQQPDKAAYYEQKISYFFTDVIPNGHAWAASVGLTFEPCGVVVHEDGSVTYITGGGDTPERVAEVARINQERDAKRAKQRKAYFAQSAAAAALRQAQFMRAAALYQAQSARSTDAAQKLPQSEVLL